LEDSIGNSEYLCSVGGVAWSHSIDDVMFRGVRVFREEENDSHIMKIRNRTPIREMIEPIEEIIFHRV
jgi:hypothetical protein